MAFIPHLEYALGEFAAFEFAREDGARLELTDLAAAGEASTGLVAISIAQAEFSISAGASVSIAAAAITDARISADGLSAVAFDGSFALLADVGSFGFSSAEFGSGYKTGGSLYAAGESIVNLVGLDGFGFDIVAEASVAINTSAISSSAASIDGSCEVLFFANAMTAATMASGSAAQPVLVANFTSNAAVSAVGVAAAGFATRSYANTGLQSAGAGSYSIPASTIRLAFVQSSGASAASIGSSAFANALLSPNGIGSMSIGAAVVRVSRVSAAGQAVLGLDPGSPVFTYMDPAYDVVERPEEPRTVEWA